MRSRGIRFVGLVVLSLASVAKNRVKSDSPWHRAIVFSATAAVIDRRSGRRGEFGRCERERCTLAEPAARHLEWTIAEYAPSRRGERSADGRLSPERVHPEFERFGRQGGGKEPDGFVEIVGGDLAPPPGDSAALPPATSTRSAGGGSNRRSSALISARARLSSRRLGGSVRRTCCEADRAEVDRPHPGSLGAGSPIAISVEPPPTSTTPTEPGSSSFAAETAPR